MKSVFPLIILLILNFGVSAIQARTVNYDLVLAKTDGPEAGGQEAMTINGSLPGPVLRFSEGDDAVINVKNDLGEETSIHWHGLLVPNDQDGVPHVNMAPIRAGETRQYRFRLRQSGTYWYHSHSVLQEQLGIYGGIVITQKGGDRIKTKHDLVAVLSDWTDEKPYDVLTQLRAGREWQGIKKRTTQSWLGALQNRAFKEFFMRSFTRMPPMDLSDVGYRYFLVNGAPEQSFGAKQGETVRLRLVNASASTYYFIEFAGPSAKIISSDGMDVAPVAPGRFLMAIAETYDLLITVPADGAYELRATAQDGSGKSSIFIGEGARRFAPDVPRANLYAGHNMAGMGGMGMNHSGAERNASGAQGNDSDEGTHTGMQHDGMGGMDHSSMSMPVTSSLDEETGVQPMNHEAMSGMEKMNHAALNHGASGTVPKAVSTSGHTMTDAGRPGSPYEKLRAVRPTLITGDRPVREYTLRLQGDMIRYGWMINGKTLTEADTINVRSGERVRFTFINETMMHHPMHLHGHFFRVLTKAGKFSPLKHTVDVPPFETRIIEFAADEPGDWLMHCHILYHAEVGMGRVVHYEDVLPDPPLHRVKGEPMPGHDPLLFFGEGTALSNMSDGFATVQNNRSGLMAAWEVGWENVEETGYEVDLTYDRYLSSFTSVFAGAELTGEEAGHRGILGVRYLLPLMFQSQIWVDTEGEFRLSLRQSIPLTARLTVYGETEFDTLARWEHVAGMEFLLNKRLSIIGQWHSEYGAGGGLSWRF